jgi:hypothetical protein
MLSSDATSDMERKNHYYPMFLFLTNFLKSHTTHTKALLAKKERPQVAIIRGKIG